MGYDGKPGPLRQGEVTVKYQEIKNQEQGSRKNILHPRHTHTPATMANLIGAESDYRKHASFDGLKWLL